MCNTSNEQNNYLAQVYVLPPSLKNSPLLETQLFKGTKRIYTYFPTTQNYYNNFFVLSWGLNF